MNPLEKFIAKYEELEKNLNQFSGLWKSRNNWIFDELTNHEVVKCFTPSVGDKEPDQVAKAIVFQRNSAKQVIEMLKFLSCERQCYTPDEWKNLDRLAEEGMAEL